MPHLMTKEMLATSVGKRRPTNLQDVFRFVNDTGHTELYVYPNTYFWLASCLQGFALVPKDTAQYLVRELHEGRTDEGLPCFSVLGLTFIMLCGEKLTNARLLK
jgi:hypothetical protein